MSATDHETPGGLTRRLVLRGGAGLLVGLGLAPAFWRTGRAAAALPVTPGAGPYGPLQPADVNGIMLPKGFSSKVVAHGRTPGAGQIYEITGPFRRERSKAAPIGGIPAPATPAPAIGLEVPQRRTRRVLLRRGIPVGLTLDEAAEVTITASTRLRVAGQLRTVRLGGCRVMSAAGPSSCD